MRGDTESRAASSKGARAETLAERGLPLEEQPVRRGAHKILQQAIKTHVAGAFCECAISAPQQRKRA